MSSAQLQSVLKIEPTTHPYSDQSNSRRLLKRQRNQMIFTGSKGCQPHVEIITRFIHAIDEIRHNSRVIAVLG